MKPVAFSLSKDFVSFCVRAEVLLCKVCLTWSVCIKKLQKASELSADREDGFGRKVWPASSESC